MSDVISTTPAPPGVGRYGGETHQGAIESIAVNGTDRRTLHTYPPRNDYSEMTFPGRLDFAPDGRKFLVVELRNHDGRIVIRDAQTGHRMKRIPARVSGEVRNAVWSPDGRRIAFFVSSVDRVLTIRPNGTGKRLAFAVSRSSDFDLIGGLAWQPRP